MKTIDDYINNAIEKMANNDNIDRKDVGNNCIIEELAKQLKQANEPDSSKKSERVCPYCGSDKVVPSKTGSRCKNCNKGWQT